MEDSGDGELSPLNAFKMFAQGPFFHVAIEPSEIRILVYYMSGTDFQLQVIQYTLRSLSFSAPYIS